MRVTQVDITRHANPHDVDIGDGLELTVGAATLHLELRECHIAR